jgi:hypothetical protein
LGLVVALAVGAWVVTTTDERAGIAPRGQPAPPRAAAEVEASASAAAAPDEQAPAEQPAAERAESDDDAEQRARMEQQIAALLAKDTPAQQQPLAQPGQPGEAAPAGEPATAELPAQLEVVTAPEQAPAQGEPDWSYAGPDSLQTILDVALPLAQQGNAVAANVARQSMLALEQKTTAYDDLESVATRAALSSEQEKKWLGQLQARANAGDAFAAHVLGIMLLFGHGMPASPIRAERLLEQAAASEGWAAFLLGELYAEGRGVAKDDKLAEKHYRQAAIKGLARATRALYDR